MIYWNLIFNYKCTYISGYIYHHNNRQSRQVLNIKYRRVKCVEFPLGSCHDLKITFKISSTLSISIYNEDHISNNVASYQVSNLVNDMWRSGVLCTRAWLPPRFWIHVMYMYVYLRHSVPGAWQPLSQTRIWREHGRVLDFSHAVRICDHYASIWWA